MRCRLVLLAFGLWLGRSFAADGSSAQVEITTTEHASFAAGGVIRVLNSFGSVTVEGWDRPEIEITVTKRLERYYEPGQREQALSALEKVHVVSERRSEGEFQISTTLPSRRFTRLLSGKGGLMRGTGAALDKLTGTVRHPLGGKGGLELEYLIHMPRDLRVVIRHGNGMVLVSDMTGDVEATSTGGDILLMLPAAGTYSIDARSKLGAVASDFEGQGHRQHLVGSGFRNGVTAPARRIYLRTRVGGIAIKAVPVEADEVKGGLVGAGAR
jgi:hypothetical protein